MHDFYSVHLLNYCHGEFVPEPVDDTARGINRPSRNITSCSKMTMTNAVDPRGVLEERMDPATRRALARAWPDEITTGLAALRSAQHASVALYIAALASLALSLMVMLGTRTSTFGTLYKLSTTVLILLESISTATLGLAGALVTVVVLEASEVVNSWGEEIGLSSIAGTKLIILAWSAWLATFAATASMLWWSRCGKRLKL